ncbi:MAG: hypothetical protein IT173_08730 [Acidobacteria bacterium]|nr:hypothetical protein [Acidobacteriota bacterium]
MQEDVRSSEEWQFGRLRNSNVFMTIYIDDLVRNGYKNDVGKLGALTSASHVEKPPKEKETSIP